MKYKGLDWADIFPAGSVAVAVTKYVPSGINSASELCSSSKVPSSRGVTDSVKIVPES